MVLLNLSLTDPATIEKIKESDPSFLCAICKTKISEKKYLVSINDGTPYHSFTNPHGFSFNILTVIYCEMIELVSAEYSEHTWFPDYSWAIIACSHCGEHIGWRFSALEKKPHIFYALIRDKLIIMED
jgi:cereblon